MNRALNRPESQNQPENRQKTRARLEYEILQREGEIADLRHQLEKSLARHRRAEDELEKSKERYRELVMYAPVGLYEIDFINQAFVDVNDVACTRTGYSKDEILSMKPLEFLTEESQKHFLERLERMWSGKKVPLSVEYQVRKKDGGTLWVLLNIKMKYEADTIVGATVVVHDISERRQMEEALRRSEDLFNLITDYTSALVSILDSHAAYLYASPSHRQLGVEPEDLIGESGFTLVDPEDVAFMRNQLEIARKNKNSKAHLNYRLRDTSGRTHYYRGSFDPVYRPDGSLEKIICVGEDITRLRQVQSEKMEALSLAAEAKQLALVGQIAGKMAHDFNNILSIIMGNAEMGLMDCRDRETRALFELIFEQTMRGRNITRNLVAFAKDQEIKQERFQVDEKIELVLNLLRKDLEGIAVIRDYGIDMPDLLADPGMIEHAVVHVLQNAIHATSLSVQPEIVIKTAHRNDHVRIEIEDNGCGIPEAYVDNVFEPAFTLKGSRDKDCLYKPGIRGTGYGLSNAKKYIEQHRGGISIDSQAGRGTRVTFRLPVIEDGLSNQEVTELKNGAEIIRGKHILLVEDEPAIAHIQSRVLAGEPLNHRVDVVANGRAAIELFEQNEYDFVSLDYILPGDVSGIDVFNHFRQTRRTLPVLFISGNLEFLESIKTLKKEDPYVDHVSKPCRNVEYINSINRLLAKSTPGK